MMNMNPLLRLVLITAAVLVQGQAQAQAGAAPSTSAAAAASTPQTVPLYGQTVTPGWPMMSKEERAAFGTAMAQLKSRGECFTFINKHYEQMSQRSLQRGLPLQGNSRRDVCNVLPN